MTVKEFVFNWERMRRWKEVEVFETFLNSKNVQVKEGVGLFIPVTSFNVDVSQIY